MSLPIFPIIEPYDWPGANKTTCRSLCWLPRIPGTPWLAFYFELDGRMNFLDQSALARLHITPSQLEALAIANVAASEPATWHAHVLPSPSGTVTVLRCVDVAHASERILVASFLAQACAMLQADALCAAVPQRGELIAARFDDHETLMTLARTAHAQAENPPLSPWVFAIQNGAITGRFFDENGTIGLDAAIRSRQQSE
jgi:hypothetical protein